MSDGTNGCDRATLTQECPRGDREERPAIAFIVDGVTAPFAGFFSNIPDTFRRNYVTGM